MRLGWRTAAGILLSIALLVWTLRDISPGDVWHVLASANLALLVVAAGVATLSFPLRAWRWRYILNPVAPSVPYGPLWRSTAIGMMANNIAPARAGEVARAYVLGRAGTGVGFAAALGSLVIDRVFDGIVVLVLLVVVIAQPGFPQGTIVGGAPVEHWLKLGAIVAIAALLIIALVAYFPTVALSVWDRLVGSVSPAMAAKGRTHLGAFTTGLGVLRDPRQFLVVLFWATLQWLVNGLSFWIGFRAVGIGATFSAALFLQSLLALGVAVPSAPGFFGVFEGITRAALTVYGVDPTRSVGFALGYHLLSFLPITAIGLWYVGRTGLHLRDLSAPPAPAA